MAYGPTLTKNIPVFRFDSADEADGDDWEDKTDDYEPFPEHEEVAED